MDIHKEVVEEGEDKTRPYIQTVSLTINYYYYYIITIREQRQCILLIARTITIIEK